MSEVKDFIWVSGDRFLDLLAPVRDSDYCSEEISPFSLHAFTRDQTESFHTRRYSVNHVNPNEKMTLPGSGHIAKVAEVPPERIRAGFLPEEHNKQFIALIASLRPVVIDGWLMFTWLDDETIAALGGTAVDITEYVPNELTTSWTYSVKGMRSPSHFSSLKEVLCRDVWIDHHGLVSVLKSEHKAEFKKNRSIQAIKFLNIHTVNKTQVFLDTYTASEITNGTSFFLAKSKLQIFVTDEDTDFIEINLLGLATFAPDSCLVLYQNSLSVLKTLVKEKTFSAISNKQQGNLPVDFLFWPSIPVKQRTTSARKVDPSKPSESCLAKLECLKERSALESLGDLSEIQKQHQALTDGLINLSNTERSLQSQLSNSQSDVTYYEQNIQQVQITLNAYLARFTQAKTTAAKAELDLKSVEEKKKIIKQNLDITKQNVLSTLNGLLADDAPKKPSSFFDPQTWRNLNFVVVNITFKDKSTHEIVEAPSLVDIVSGLVVFSKVELETIKPSKIVSVEDSSDVRVAGPYKITLDFPNSDYVYMSIKLLDDRSVRGYYNNGYIVHPHAQQINYLNATWSHWQQATNTVLNTCLGEALPILWKAGSQCDLASLLYGLTTWLTAANPNDAWGSHFKYLPEISEFNLELFDIDKDYDPSKTYYYSEELYYHSASKATVTILTEEQRVTRIESTVTQEDSNYTLTEIKRDSLRFLNFTGVSHYSERIQAELLNLDFKLILKRNLVLEPANCFTLEENEVL